MRLGRILAISTIVAALTGCSCENESVDAGPAPGITVAPTSGLTTTEAGASASFTVVLDRRPTAEVVIALSSSDETEGTVSPARLVFTADNWNAPQAVAVTGVDDELADGRQEYLAVTAPAQSADSNYQGSDAADVAIGNVDDETAGVTVEPLSGLTTTEAGGSASFTVVLHSQPTATVAFAVASGDETEGTVSPAGLVFTPENWKAPQVVTVTGVDDDLADGAQTYQVFVAPAESQDADYAQLDPDDVEVSNTDDETAGITVDREGALATTEAGGSATFTVVLNSQPTADVSVAISSSDETEGTISPASLTFTSLNWRAPQTVTITGVDDDVMDGNQPFTIVIAAAESEDPNYQGIDAADVALSNTDDETAGITVDPVDGLTVTEAGSSATFTVVLTSEPTADVTIAISSSDETEGTISPASLTFTAANWRAPQTVTITGVGDDVMDGNQPFFVVTGAAVS